MGKMCLDVQWICPKLFDCLRHLIIGSFVAGNDKITTHIQTSCRISSLCRNSIFAEILLKSNWHLVGLHHKVVKCSAGYLWLPETWDFGEIWQNQRYCDNARDLGNSVNFIVIPIFFPNFCIVCDTRM